LSTAKFLTFTYVLTEPQRTSRSPITHARGKVWVRIPGRAKNFSQVCACFAFAIEFINRFYASYAQKFSKSFTW